MIFVTILNGLLLEQHDLLIRNIHVAQKLDNFFWLVLGIAIFLRPSAAQIHVAQNRVTQGLAVLPDQTKI